MRSNLDAMTDPLRGERIHPLGEADRASHVLEPVLDISDIGRSGWNASHIRNESNAIRLKAYGLQHRPEGGNDWFDRSRMSGVRYRSGLQRTPAFCIRAAIVEIASSSPLTTKCSGPL